MSKLTLNNKINIMYDVNIEKMYHAEVAEKYGVKTSCISNLVRLDKMNPSYLEELEFKERELDL